jgi:arsenate reductase
MANGKYNILFLCTGNSARSILAEALLNHRAKGRLLGFSAGSHPTGRVNPGALEVLQRMNIPIAGLRSKAWDEFAQAAAPRMDFIFTVCDNAAGEVCPIWPGHPMTAHWGLADPAHFDDPRERAQAFTEAFRILSLRVDRLLGLPLNKLDSVALANQLSAIGKEMV